MHSAKFRFLSLALMLASFVRPVTCQGQSPKPLAETPLPKYVLEYAPLVWLESHDTYYPSGIDQQLVHTTPMVDWQPVPGAPSPDTLRNLDLLNSLSNSTVYLTSKEGNNATPPPAWFQGATLDATGKTDGAVCSVVITRDHGDGMVDAFYFYFYAYNAGNTVLGMEFGNHIGDWEHNMVRFQNGVPQALWYAQHAGGQAFTYDALEKREKRPYAYSAKGTHAVYSIAGDHDHTIPHLNLPGGLIVDRTDQGTLWDPVLSSYAYSYDANSKEFHPYDPSYPLNWLYYNGRWGDDALPGGPGIFGEKKYAAGPTGPKDKQLARDNVCPSDPCIVLPFTTWAKAE